jgi:hypothetical protein
MKGMKEFLCVFLPLWALVLLIFALLIILGEDAEAADSPAAPTAIVIVSCRVTDWTDKRPLPDNVPEVARGWRDLELFVNSNQEYECRRDVLHLEDGAYFGPDAPDELINLIPNFGDPSQCARVGMMQVPTWNEQHPGYGVVAVGCPVPIVADEDADGQPDMDEHGKYKVLDWRLPGCPTFLPGTQNRMKCSFTESEI